jgi:hypothetical protein
MQLVETLKYVGSVFELSENWIVHKS